MLVCAVLYFFFFFNDTATTEIYTLSLHDALPISNWLVFLWMLARLPREPVDSRGAVRAALAAAIGFEALKWLGGVYLGLVGRSPVGVAFGGVVGLLVFIYLVARMLMLVTAWTVEAARDHQAAQV